MATRDDTCASSLPDGLKGGQLVTLPAGTRVFQAGDACTQFFYLIRGAIRVDLIAKGGRAIMLYRFGADQTCVLTTSCLLSGDKYCAEAHTESDVQAYVVPFASFEAQLNQSEAFRRLIFSSFSDRLAAMMERIEEVAFVPIETRLATRLLTLTASDGLVLITHDQLANDLGTAREVVSRKLAQWEKSGLIERARGAVRLVNVRKLENIAALGD